MRLAWIALGVLIGFVVGILVAVILDDDGPHPSTMLAVALRNRGG